MVTDETVGGREILIATGNPGKFHEIITVLSDWPVEGGPTAVLWRSLKDLPGEIAEPSEDGETFAENAAIKAVYYARASGLWTLADDSGLEVDALGGVPGVRSARYAQVSAGALRPEVTRANNERLISELAGVPTEGRTARFRCALALADGNRVLATAEGGVEGRIVDEPRGSNGFGYDPHFYLPALEKTMAELSAAQKNRISHRGAALRRFRAALWGLLGEGPP